MEEKSFQHDEPKADANSPSPAKADLSNPQAQPAFPAGFDIGPYRSRHTFKALERLKRRKLIDTLFAKGQAIKEFPLTAVYLHTPLEDNIPAQVAFSVPKRHFKKAADRNRIKRLMREVYRQQKVDWYQHLVEKENQCVLMFVYHGKLLLTYNEAQDKISRIMARLREVQ